MVFRQKLHTAMLARCRVKVPDRDSDSRFATLGVPANVGFIVGVYASMPGQAGRLGCGVSFSFSHDNGRDKKDARLRSTSHN